MDYDKKLQDASNKCELLTKKIESFKSGKPEDQARWSEAHVGELLDLESRLRDAQRLLQNINDSIARLNMVRDHRSGKLVRI